MSLPIIPLAISVLRSALPADRVGPAMGLISSSLGSVALSDCRCRR